MCVSSFLFFSQPELVCVRVAQLETSTPTPINKHTHLKLGAVVLCLDESHAQVIALVVVFAQLLLELGQLDPPPLRLHAGGDLLLLLGLGCGGEGNLARARESSFRFCYMFRIFLFNLFCLHIFNGFLIFWVSCLVICLYLCFCFCSCFFFLMLLSFFM